MEDDPLIYNLSVDGILICPITRLSEMTDILLKYFAGDKIEFSLDIPINKENGNNK